MWSRSVDLVNPFYNDGIGALLDSAVGGCRPHCGEVLVVGYGEYMEGLPATAELYTPAS